MLIPICQCSSQTFLHERHYSLLVISSGSPTKQPVLVDKLTPLFNAAASSVAKQATVDCLNKSGETI